MSFAKSFGFGPKTMVERIDRVSWNLNKNVSFGLTAGDPVDLWKGSISCPALGLRLSHLGLPAGVEMEMVIFYDLVAGPEDRAT
jgi:hypothetical protein